MGHGASPGNVDQADGNLEDAMKPSCEIIADSRAVLNLSGNGPPPVPLRVLGGLDREIILRLEVRHLGQAQEADRRGIRRLELEVGVPGRAQGPFHVALASADPDFADEHVLVGQAFLSRRDD